MATVRLERPPERIAVVRALRGLGDMLCAVPALRALRAGFPGAQIELVGLPWMSGFVERFDCVDRLVEFPGFPGVPEVPFDPRRLTAFIEDAQGRYDLALQLHGSGTNSNSFTALLGAKTTAGYFLPALWCPDPHFFLPYPAHLHEIHRCLRIVEFLGASSQGDHLEFPELPEDRGQLELAWPGWQEKPYACLHPGAFEAERRWPIERFAATGDSLTEAGFTVVITGSPGERELTSAVVSAMRRPAIDLGGRTALGALANLLRGASLLVSNDTGVSHLAVAVGTPSVVVFSASDPGRWGPLDRSLHRTVGRVMPDRVNACVHTEEVKGHRCLRDACSSVALPGVDEWQPATVEEVLSQALDLTGARR